MKFLFLLLFPVICFAGTQSVVRDASSTAIPAAYTTAGSEIMSSVRANKVCCINYTDETIGVCLRANAAASCGDDWYMETGGSFCFDEHPLADKIFMKGWDGAISSGIVVCRVWLKN